MNTQTKNFTTTFSVSLLEWLDSVSSQMGVSKKAIIEQALERWKKDYIRQQIRKSYADIPKDPEMNFWSEAGMGQYLQQIEKCEK